MPRRVAWWLLVGSVAACADMLGADFGPSKQGPGECAAVADVACYEGPEGSEGVGECRAGTRSCSDDASSAAVCQGQVLPAVDCTLDDIDEHCDGQTGAHAWSGHYGGMSLQRLRDMALDGSGNLLLTGYSYGSIALGAAALPAGMFAIKLDPLGVPVWGKTFPDAAGEGIAVTAAPDGDLVFAGPIKQAVDFGGGVLSPPAGGSAPVIVKLDADDGGHVWSQMLGSQHASDQITSVTADAAGRLLIGGYFHTAIEWPNAPTLFATPGGRNAFIALLDPDGEHLLSRRYGPGATITRLELDSHGAVVAVGFIDSATNFGGEPIGGAGLTTFVAKITADGKHVFSRALGEGSLVLGMPAVAIAADDSLWMAMPFLGTLEIEGVTLTNAGTLDVAVLHFSGTGELLHASRYGGPDDDVSWDLALDSVGNVVIAGSFRGTLQAGGCSVSSTPCAATDGCYDAFLLKLDPNGAPVWLRAFGDAYDSTFDGWFSDAFFAVDIRADDSIVAAGQCDGSLSFGGELIEVPRPFELKTPSHDICVASYRR